MGPPFDSIAAVVKNLAEIEMKAMRGFIHAVENFCLRVPLLSRSPIPISAKP